MSAIPSSTAPSANKSTPGVNPDPTVRAQLEERGKVKQQIVQNLKDNPPAHQSTTGATTKDSKPSHTAAHQARHGHGGLRAV